MRAARTALGEACFVATWAQGQAMDAGEAVDTRCRRSPAPRGEPDGIFTTGTIQRVREQCADIMVAARLV